MNDSVNGHPGDRSAIAIVGMACLFPRANCLGSFWQLIYQGADAITDLPVGRWPAHASVSVPMSRVRGGFLSPVAFDPAEIGIPPADLESIDTSQLLALAATQAALADAGYLKNGRSFDHANTSVIIGASGPSETIHPLADRLNSRRWHQALKRAGVSDDQISAILHQMAPDGPQWTAAAYPGLLANVIAGRICNRFDLGGVNCSVDAACASAMAAVHMAVLELVAGHSDMVIAGGVDTLNDPFMYQCFASTQILSETGDLRPFSAHADGTLPGEGIGILILKRLADARQDNSRIYATIRATGCSSDGRQGGGIYAPSSNGQRQALTRAYQRAGIDPGTVDLIEAHATGAPLGDRVEIETLKHVFKSNGRRQPMAIGSVKSMIGHTKAAAGAAGLIKAALALHHKVLPPTLKAEPTQPEFAVSLDRFAFLAHAKPWFGLSDTPRRAGVSAMGFGGTNYHVVLQEHGASKTDVWWQGPATLLAFSGPNLADLQRQTQVFYHRVGSTDIDRVRFEAAQLRAQYNCLAPLRLLIAYPLDSAASLSVATINDWLAHQDASQPDKVIIHGPCYLGIGPNPAQQPKLAYLFPGQGSQYPHMGKDWVARFPEAFAAIDAANAAFESDVLLSDMIYPWPHRSNAAELNQTHITQPAIGAICMAMHRVLARFGIQPTVVGGHSFGELCALNAAGWLDDDDFMALAVTRGRLMAEAGKKNQHGGGSMLAVRAPLAALEKMVGQSGTAVVLANRNSPKQGVLSGAEDDIARMQAICRQAGFGSMRLPVSAAFHSPLVARAQAPFAQHVDHTRFTPGATAVYANATALPYPTDLSQIRSTLGNQLTQSVNFVDMIENMYTQGVRIFLEVGPKSVLSGLMRRILAGRPAHIISVDRSASADTGLRDLGSALCHLAAAGYPVAIDRWDSPSDAPPPAATDTTVWLTGANYRHARASVATPCVMSDSVANARENDTVGNQIIALLSELTGYPEDSIDADMNLEEDLGIDSIRWMEIVVAIEEMMPSQSSSLADGFEHIHTPRQLAQFLHTQSQSKPVTEQRLSDSAPADWVSQKLVAAIAAATGYPVESIAFDKQLTADLGIDSIRLAQIIDQVMTGLPGISGDAADVDGSVKTLADLVNWMVCRLRRN